MLLSSNLVYQFNAAFGRLRLSNTLWADVVSPNNMATLSNDPILSAGQPSFFSFNGVSQDVFMNNPYPAQNSSAFTFAIWFSSRPQLGQPLLGFETVQSGTAGSANDRKLWFGSDHKLRFGVWDDQPNSLCSVVSHSSVDDGLWRYAVATFDGRWLNLYINGSLAANPSQYSSSSKDPPSGLWLRVASYLNTFPYGANGYFGGNIAAFQVYSAALTAAQVWQNYQADINGYSSSIIACPVGTYNGVFGQSSYYSCLPCPMGTFCPVTGLSSPIPIPYGFLLAGNSTATLLPIATAGFSLRTTNTSIACPAGTHVLMHTFLGPFSVM